MMKTKRLIQRIKTTVRENNLISSGDRVLVALSGGADSVFLLHVLKDLSTDMDFDIAACHVEHGIRGGESVRDMNFSQKLCRSMEIDFYVRRIDVPGLAAREKLSLEAAGRKARYEYFAQLMKENGFSRLATAHHRDDKVETVVMNILRGCGLRGYVGIEYKNGDIIRPLLDITKQEIVEYCSSNNISYCTDKTNMDTEYTRNRIRHCLLPGLREFNPSFDEALLRQSRMFAEDDDYLNSAAAEALKDCATDECIDIKKILTMHTALQRRIMYMYLADGKGTKSNISYMDVDAALSLCEKGETGKRYSLSGGMEVEVAYGNFFVVNQKKQTHFEYSLEFGVPVEIKEIGLRVTLLPEGGRLLIAPDDKVVLRSRRPGDRFCPVGMCGTKKLKDFFTDNKVPREIRGSIPILTVNGEIASVVGMRRDRRFFDSGGKCMLLTETLQEAEIFAKKI